MRRPSLLVAYEAVERRYADAVARVPCCHGKACRLKPIEHLMASSIINAIKVEARAITLALAQPVPVLCSVAFDDFTDSMTYSLEHVIAGCQAVRGRKEATATRGLRQRVVGVDRLKGQPHRAVVQQLVA